MKKHGVLTAAFTFLVLGLVSCGNMTDFTGNQNKTNTLDALPQLPEEPVKLDSLRITPESAMVTIGSITPYQAIAVFSDGAEKDVSTVATWSTGDASLAKVGNDDDTIKIFAEALGSTTVKANFNGLDAVGTLEIVASPPPNIEIVSLKVVPNDALISVGKSLQFKSFAVLNDGSEVEITNGSDWVSNNTNFVTLDPNSKGLATAKGIGQTMIIAYYKEFAGSADVTIKDADLMSLQVTPASVVLFNGEAQVYTATGTYSDGSMRDVSAIASWSSANAVIGSFSNAGIGNTFIAKNVGTTQVTASIGAIAGNAMVQVKIIPGIPVYRFGLNFEDLNAINFAGVLGKEGDPLVDHNDFVLCFDGKARVNGQAITSLEDQKISFFTGHDSTCSHTATVEVYTKDSMGGDVILQQILPFSTPTDRLYTNINFPKFAMIRAKLDIFNQPGCTDGAPGNMVTWYSSDANQVEVLQNVCRFKDNHLPIYYTPPPVK